MPLIEARELSKRFKSAVRDPGFSGAVRHLLSPRYDERVAVDGLDLNIEAGQTVAYVGPNGAGKSTTIKMLTGILVPSGGELSVGGLVPHRARIQNAQRIGVVFGQRTQLWWDLAVRDSLELQRKIYAVPASVFRDNLERFTRLLDLGGFLHLTARKISLGLYSGAGCGATRARATEHRSRAAAATGPPGRDRAGPITLGRRGVQGGDRAGLYAELLVTCGSGHRSMKKE